MEIFSNLLNLPVEMRSRRQWALSGVDKAPYTMRGGELCHTSVTNGEWLDFETAYSLACRYGTYPGYILTAEDEFVCIDLDVKDSLSLDKTGFSVVPDLWTQQETLNGYSELLYRCKTYSEVSASGKGLHVWLRGSIGKGVRNNGIEVYSQERFIICTGNAVSTVRYGIFDDVCKIVESEDKILPIAQRDDILQEILSDIRLRSTSNYIPSTNDQRVELIEAPEEITDEEVFAKAETLEGSKLLEDLKLGDWADLGYPSQSEADFLLMSIIAAHSQSNAQCRRCFRSTGLGQRDKATKNDRYLNFTLSLIRGQQEHKAKVKINLSLSYLQPTTPDGDPIPGVNPRVKIDLKLPDSNKQSSEDSQDDSDKTVTAPKGTPSITWPPGIMGRLAAYIYNSSKRPVKEVSIVTALGFMAGIAGKAFSISDTGLNLYLILIGESGVGKDTLHNGMSLLLNRLGKSFPAVYKYVEFSDFPSGSALVRACSKQSCFVHVGSEWGRKLTKIAEDKDSSLQQLRTIMTGLYTKSAPGMIVGGISYSDSDRNIDSINGIAYSMVGETTPDTFYNCLTDNMMTDGFLSRFNLFQYTGKRPKTNRLIVTDIDPELHDILCGLVGHSLELSEKGQHVKVKATETAQQALDDFDEECDNEINATREEVYRHMWIRAHFKVLRISGLLAVADNHVLPVVKDHHVAWSIQLLRSEIAIMSKKMRGGDIGTSDSARELRILSVMRDYLVDKKTLHGLTSRKLHAAKIISRRHIQERTTRHAGFALHRNGPSAVMDFTLRCLEDNGYIEEIHRAQLKTVYGYRGKAYQIINLPEDVDE